MVELKKILAGLIVVNCLLSQVTLASEVEKEHKIYMDISKTGLNKISNPPYKITDVIGDSSTFEIQSKMDGEYIYLTPKVRVDEHIEISIKNNIGKLIEFVFKVTDITSQTITVDDKKSKETTLVF